MEVLHNRTVDAPDNSSTAIPVTLETNPDETRRRVAGGGGGDANLFPFGINLSWLSALSNRKFFCISILLMMISLVGLVSNLVDVMASDKQLLLAFVSFISRRFLNTSVTDGADFDKM